MSSAEANPTSSQWKAPPGAAVPDFIICGAMKSGTSTVHMILDQHPRVFIPREEVHFFDIDDPLQHPDFFFFDGENWHYPDMDRRPECYWDYYQRYFREATPGAMLGEDSTCYLPSRAAPQRIALQDKPIKTIICLRDPTRRSFSNYLHLLQTGRAAHSFEEMIRYSPHQVLERSLYKQQIEHWLRFIPRERVYFFILERFIENKETTLREIHDFLGLPYEELPEAALEQHVNRARYPRFIGMQLWLSRVLPGDERYDRRLAEPVPKKATASWLKRLVHFAHRKVNPHRSISVPEIKPGTKQFLDNYFKRELEGINELTGMDVTRWWFRKN